MTRWRNVIGILAFVSVWPGMGMAHSSTSDPRDPEAYVIGPEDLLEVSIWKNDALTRTVPVRPDGRISLPLLGDVTASNMTPRVLRDSLAKAYATYVPQPEVSVIVREIHSMKISVVGQVKTPGRYELKSRA